MLVKKEIKLIEAIACMTCAYFGNIRTPIPEVCGQHNGNIRTL